MNQDTTTFSFPPLSLNQSCPCSVWTRSDDKQFEEALVHFPEELSDRWQRIGAYLNRSRLDVEHHYEVLVQDVNAIDQGWVELPPYADMEFNCNSAPGNQTVSGSGGAERKETERKKGTPWTEDEHRKFLLGLKMEGKGDWRSISRKWVISRTPTQVASHAQKYFLRQNSTKKERKRSSIHDITTDSIDVHLVPTVPALVQQQPQMNHQPKQESPQEEYQSYGYPM